MQNELLSEDVKNQVREVFAQLQDPIEVLFFGTQQDCDYCGDTLKLIGEVAALSERVGLTILDINENQALAQQYKVDKTPGIVIAGREGSQILDYGIRLSGIPSGHEFSTLIHDMILVSGRDSGLQSETRQALAELKQSVLLQVFVTPTCPYCPRAVLLAHQMALESPMVEAEMVEANEFPELSMRFGVSGVPQTTINAGAGTVVGAVPEEHLLAEILRVSN